MEILGFESMPLIVLNLAFKFCKGGVLLGSGFRKELSFLQIAGKNLN